MQAGLRIAGSAGPSAAVTLSAPEIVRIPFLVGHPDQACFLISEIEQEPASFTHSGSIDGKRSTLSILS